MSPALKKGNQGATEFPSGQPPAAPSPAAHCARSTRADGRESPSRPAGESTGCARRISVYIVLSTMPVPVFFSAHLVEKVGHGGEIHAQRIGKIAIYVAVFFFGRDGQNQQLRFFQFAEFHTLSQLTHTFGRCFKACLSVSSAILRSWPANTRRGGRTCSLPMSVAS